MQINTFLERAVKMGASDVHLKAGGPAYLRIDGDLKPLSDIEALSPSDTESLARQMMDDRSARHFLMYNEADFAYSLTPRQRFRVNVFRQRDVVGIVARMVAPQATALPDLGLPKAVQDLAEEHRGLVLVTGPTGSGKTTTTAAMVDHINRSRRCHIVTVEDPIEILHEDRQALVDQREIGNDTRSFETALRSVARQDPDVIFIGEMRDAETVMAAIQAAETGHLVISTLHTTDATETVNRTIDFFPPDQQAQVRMSLAKSLKGIVCQRLVSRMTGHGRVPVVEVMRMTSRLNEFILDSSMTERLVEGIEEGGYYGMQTFDQHLLQLLASEEVSIDDAMRAATNQHDLAVKARSQKLIA